MTDFFTDFIDDWDRAAARREHEAALRHEQQRQALAALLIARGEDVAAALVAISAWRVTAAGDYGNDLRGVLAVPPPQYDLVTDSIHAALEAAGSAIVGDDFTGIDYQVRLTDVTLGWDVALLTWLRDEHRDGTSHVRVAPRELPTGTDGR